jgi:rod shape determining protein RodA
MQLGAGTGRWGERRRIRWFFLVRGFHMDVPLFAALLVLSVIGLVTLYSASARDMDVVERQFLRLSFAFATMFVIAQVPPHHLQRWAPWLFGAGLSLLAAVLIMGEIGKGAQRWLDLGIIRFQPSELMKIAVPMMAAWYLAEQSLPPRTKPLLLAAGLTVVPTVMIAKQPDLGTALLVMASGVFVILLAGVSWRRVASVVLLTIPVAWFMWEYGMHDYQRNRVLTFLNPQSDPLGTGYHIIQSEIAIGSGGLYGKGWLNGSQAHLEFLPESSTDFIFAAFSEEFGLMGSALLLCVYLFIIGRGLYIASQAQSTFTRLFAGSLTMTFFVYVFVNIGMVTGLLPVVGVPLPLISYGGTSLVTLMAAFGILMSIHTHRKLLPT